MNQSNRATISLPSDREIMVTRVFDAPRALVFRAHTDPALLPLWWGPRDWTTVVDQFDLRPGGAWRIVYRTPDGSEYGLRGEFREIAPPERLVWTFGYEGLPGEIEGMPEQFIVQNFTFTEQDGKTTLTTHEVYATAEERAGMLASDMESGMNDAYARLDELIVQQLAAHEG